MKRTDEMRIPLTRNDLASLKTRALRRGVWYRVLTRVERTCIDLVIKVVERVRSFLVKKMLSPILGKLEEAMESHFQRVMREVGGNLALKLIQVAQEWGNQSAGLWSKDDSFMQYLTITYMNAPS